MSSLVELQYLANSFDVFCLQESLLSPLSSFSVPGFHILRRDVTSAKIRGLCVLIRADFLFSAVDTSSVFHPSIEIMGILLHCSLDAPILILNVYRHPNTNTPSHVFRSLFAMASSSKYSLIVGDFNAHHQAWGDARNDVQGEHILQSIDDFQMILLNDGAATFFSSSGISTSCIDLSISSRELGPQAVASTLADLYGSDHFPVSITVSNTSPSLFRHFHKLKLTNIQLTALHTRLFLSYPHFSSAAATSLSFSDPLAAYDFFYSFLLDSISSLFPSGLPSSGKRSIPRSRSPAPWWNDRCSDAVSHRRSLLRLYKSCPTLDNWDAYRRETLVCRRVLRKEKLLGWRSFCSDFTHKTPTAEIWRFIRSFKNKSLRPGPPPDEASLRASQNVLLSKLCPPSCLHLCSLPLHILKSQDSPQSPYSWMDDPFTSSEFESAIKVSKRNSSPGLDRLDYSILRALPSDFCNFLLSVYNDLFSLGLFPASWKNSLLIFLPKSDGRGVRPIALLSCLLKLLERLVYRRLQWAVETRFILPEFQSGFRASRSCTDNLVILTNRIHSGFLHGAFTFAVFLDIEGAFDNVIPSILVQDLRDIGFPAQICKFIENLLMERFIFYARNGTLSGPLTTHKGTPQGSILSPLLFNIYLRNIGRSLHADSHIIQYADDIVLFATDSDLCLARDSLNASLIAVSSFLRQRGLTLSPLKSKTMIFSNRRTPPIPPEPILLDGLEIPLVDSVRFLGVLFDSRLNGTLHSKALISKGYKVANIITSLTGVWWGAHPSWLLSVYRAVFRGAIEYGAQIFPLYRNRVLFLKLQRQQFRIIRAALGLRQSTPINILLAEAREPPLNLRFSTLTSRYVFRSLARNDSLVVRSLRRLDISSRSSSRLKRIHLIKTVPSFKPYILQNYVRDIMFRSLTPPPFSFSYQALFPTPSYHLFDILDCSSKKKNKSPNISISEIRQRFQDFASPLIGNGIAIYTDGSKKDDDSPVGSAVFSPELHLAIKHRLPSDASIFSAEAWAILQALILLESSPCREAAVFSDSRSVLDALSSFSIDPCSNYLISMIRSKFHEMTSAGYSIALAWVPSHWGIWGNERADLLAKQAASQGHKPRFKTPATDLLLHSQRSLKDKFLASLESDFRTKGASYYTYFFKSPLPAKPWFFHLSLPRSHIVTINRLRSNHYNLNFSLFRKNINGSPYCQCGDPRQDVNHVIFRCPLTRHKSHKLLSYLHRLDPNNSCNLFPFIDSPSPKFCRLLVSFFKSNDLPI